MAPPGFDTGGADSGRLCATRSTPAAPAATVGVAARYGDEPRLLPLSALYTIMPDADGVAVSERIDPALLLLNCLLAMVVGPPALPGRRMLLSKADSTALIAAQSCAVSASIGPAAAAAAAVPAAATGPDPAAAVAVLLLAVALLLLPSPDRLIGPAPSTPGPTFN